jgi:hypothetical protein
MTGGGSQPEGKVAPHLQTVDVRGRGLMTDGGTGRWAVAISVIALAITGYSAYLQQGDQADNRAALTQVKNQFVASGPNYTVKADLEVWNSKTSKWRDSEKPGTVLPYEDVQPPNLLYINVFVTNTGRARGSITDVGVMTDPRTPLTATEVYCIPINSTKTRLESCNFPILLEEQKTIRFYVNVTDAVRTALTCNPYAQNGITVFSRSSDEKLVQKNTEAGIAYSTYCVKLPKPAKSSPAS